MKHIKRILFCIVAIIFGNNAYSQTCKNIVNIYPGPQNTAQLVYVLNHSTKSIITALSCSQKTSLETYMVFNAGMPIGMSGSDSNIAAIYSNTAYCDSLFSAIFGVADVACTSTTKPTVTSITLAEFYSMICGTGGGSGSKLSSTPVTYTFSHCLNCATPNPDGSGPDPSIGQCCNPPGGGCWDSMILIGTSYYYVSPPSL